MEDIFSPQTNNLSQKVSIGFGEKLGIRSVLRGEFEGVLAIIFHHTDGAAPGMIPTLKKNNTGYHYAIYPPDLNGNVRIQELVPPWEKTGGATENNHATVHIAFVGKEACKPQIEAARELLLSVWFKDRLAEKMKNEFATPLYIMGHRNVEPKGVDMDAFAASVGLKRLPSADATAVQKQIFREIYERAGYTAPAQ